MTKIILESIDIQPLLKAQLFLTSALQEAQSHLEKAGAIKAFKICYELAWKTMKRILAYRGIEVASPREVFRAAAQENIIDNLEAWFETIHKRNLTVHIYNEEIADEIFGSLPQFAKKFSKFIETIKVLKE